MVARNAAGREQDAKVDVTDRRRDLALLTVARDFGPPLTFRNTPACAGARAWSLTGFRCWACFRLARP